MCLYLCCIILIMMMQGRENGGGFRKKTGSTSGAVGPLRSRSGDLPGLRPSSTLASRDVGGFRTGVAKREGRSQSGDHPAAPGGE